MRCYLQFLEPHRTCKEVVHSKSYNWSSFTNRTTKSLLRVSISPHRAMGLLLCCCACDKELQKSSSVLAYSNNKCVRRPLLQGIFIYFTVVAPWSFQMHQNLSATKTLFPITPNNSTWDSMAIPPSTTTRLVQSVLRFYKIHRCPLSGPIIHQSNFIKHNTLASSCSHLGIPFLLRLQVVAKNRLNLSLHKCPRYRWVRQRTFFPTGTIHLGTGTLK